jgi:hypothetical protein
MYAGINNPLIGLAITENPKREADSTQYAYLVLWPRSLLNVVWHK